MSLNQCGINPPLDLSPQRREPQTQGTPGFPRAGPAAPDPPPPHPPPAPPRRARRPRSLRGGFNISATKRKHAANHPAVC